LVYYIINCKQNSREKPNEQSQGACDWSISLISRIWA